MAKSKLRGWSLLLTLAIGVALICCGQASGAPQTTSQLAQDSVASTTTLASVSVGGGAVTSPRGVKRASQQVINSNGVVASESTTPRAKNFDALMAGRPFYSIKDGKTSARRIQQQQPQFSSPIASSRQQQQQKNDEDEQQNRLLTELMDNLQATGGGTSESPSMSTTTTGTSEVDTNGQQLTNQQVSQAGATPADSSGIGANMMLIDSFNQLVSSDVGQQQLSPSTPASNNAAAAAADSTGEPNESTSTGSVGSPAVSSLSMSLDGMIVNSRPRGGQTKSPTNDEDRNQVAVTQQSSGATPRIGQQSPEGQDNGAPPTTSRNGKPAGSSRRVPFSGQPFSSPASKGQRTRPKASNNQTPRQQQQQQQQTGSGDNAPTQQEQQQQQQQQQVSTTQVPAGFADEQSANMMEQVNLIGGGGANQFNQSSTSNSQLIETQRPLATKLANGDMLMSVVSSDDGKERRLVMISRDTLDSLQRFAASAAAAQQRQQLQQQQQQQQPPPQQSKTSGKLPPPQSGGFVGGPSNSWWPSSTTTTMTSSPGSSRQSFNQQDEQTATTTTTGSSLDQTITTSTPTPQTVNFVTAVAGQMAPRSTTTTSSSGGLRATGSGEPTTTATSTTTKRLNGSDQILTTTLAPSISSTSDESNTSTTQQSTTTNEDNNTFREVSKPEVRSKVTGRGGKQSGTKTATSKAQKSSTKSGVSSQRAKQNSASKQQQAVGKSSSAAAAAAVTQQRNNSMQRNGSSRGNQTLATGTTKQQPARQKSGQSGKQSSSSSSSVGKRNKSANNKNTSSTTAPPPTPTPTTPTTTTTTTTTASPLITTTTSSSPADTPTSPATPMSRRELDRQLDELERGLGGGGGDDGGSDSSTGSGRQDSRAEMRQPAQFEPNSERVQSELDGLRAAIPGEPLIDYPIYSQPPTRARSFQCQAQSCPGGYYADLEAQCQVFHVCQNDGRMDTFLCPNGTIFSQQHFVCVWWWQVDCAQATKFYRLNDAIYCNSMTLPALNSNLSSDFNQRISSQSGDSSSSSSTVGNNQRDELSTTQSSSGATDQSSGSTAPAAAAATGVQSNGNTNSESDLNQQQQQQLELLARRAA